MKKVRLEEMSWLEFSWAMAETDLVIVPIGSIEQHGLHNPLGTDYMIAEADAYEVGKRVGAVVAPTMVIGNARNLMAFPGTCTIDEETLIDFTTEVADQLIGHGAKRLLFVNGHGGNSAALRMACAKIYEKHQVLAIVTEWWLTLREISDFSCADHGGEHETSYLMAACGEDCGIDMTKVQDADRKNPSENIVYEPNLNLDGVPIKLGSSLDRLTPLGNYGCPASKANLKFGQDMRAVYLDYLEELCQDMMKMVL